jgi:hypothetical protein
MPKSRLLLVAALLAASLPGVSLAEGTSVWSAKTNGSFVTLTYGPLTADKAPLFMLSCFNGMGIAVLDVRPGLSDDTKPGTPLTIALTGGDQTAKVEGEATRDEESGTTFAESSDTKVKPILDVLRTTGPVTLKAGTASTELPDAGRADAVNQFSQDCTLD